MKPIIQGTVAVADYHDIGTLVVTTVMGGDWEVDDIFNCQDKPVTILPGHLAESLRWRKVGEEEPEEGVLYVVDGLGVCRLYIDGDGDRAWVSHKFGDIYDGFEDDEIYRPAVAGLDYVEGV